MKDDDEEEFELPAWSPPLFGWQYRVTPYDDGTAALESLPEWLSVAYNAETWRAEAKTEVLDIDTGFEDIEDLFDYLTMVLKPLKTLFKP